MWSIHPKMHDSAIVYPAQRSLDIAAMPRAEGDEDYASPGTTTPPTIQKEPRKLQGMMRDFLTTGGTHITTAGAPYKKRGRKPKSSGNFVPAPLRGLDRGAVETEERGCALPDRFVAEPAVVIVRNKKPASEGDLLSAPALLSSPHPSLTPQKTPWRPPPMRSPR